MSRICVSPRLTTSLRALLAAASIGALAACGDSGTTAETTPTDASHAETVGTTPTDDTTAAAPTDASGTLPGKDGGAGAPAAPTGGNANTSGFASGATGSNTGIPAANASRAAGHVVAELSTVNFERDSSTLSDAAKKALDANAEWLKANAAMRIQAEGHCDEDGTAEYNYTLGQKRADAVREYLVSKGIDATRIETISYGKDRPIDPSGTADAKVKNRRVQFLAF